jgi:hypothetical protein
MAQIMCKHDVISINKNQKIDAWRASSKKVDSTFLVG